MAGVNATRISFTPLMKFERSRRGFARALDAVEARDDLAEDLLELHAREVGAEAVVLAVAERHVVVGRAADVEALRLGEHVLVAVRRRIPEDQLRVLLDLLAADLALLGRGAPERVHRRAEAQDLLDRAVEQRHVLLQRAQLVRVVEQADHAVAW